ncbi:MAG: hypothetical protein AAGK97_11535, partial [Bacteroidota bacterium]
PVLGADMYNVNVLLGPTGMMNGNSYTISDLNPGDSVAIFLEAVSSGLCENSTATFSCLATDCQFPDVMLDEVEPICQVSNAPTIQLNATVMPQGNGTGRWSGPGILMRKMGYSIQMMQVFPLERMLSRFNIPRMLVQHLQQQ